MLLGLNPVVVVTLLCFFTIFGNDLEFINEDMVGMVALFVNLKQGVILNIGRKTS